MELIGLALDSIKGVGRARCEKFERLGIFDVEDLLTYYPADYVDRTLKKKICDLVREEQVCFCGQILSPVKEIRVKANLRIYEAKIDDGSGTVRVVWFNQPYIKFKLLRGKNYVFFGKVDGDKKLTVTNPVFEEMELENSEFAGIMPVYGLTFGLSQNMVRKTVKTAISNFGGEKISVVPAWIREQYGLDFSRVQNDIHFPQSFEVLKKARHTLVFEELFYLQVRLLKIRETIETVKKSRVYKAAATIVSEFIEGLPFGLTNAQLRTISEIVCDMNSERIMNRLVQGDVGSGKTVIAAVAIYKVVKSGFQAILMAPTEVLAKQHMGELQRLFDGQGIRIALLTGSVKKADKVAIKEGLAKGSIDLVIGTHAVIQDDVEFERLALVVTDEQHRFGVRQRFKAASKGNDTDVLVMSATPIPRSLALVLYGDMDVSIIDEMPKGRIPIETFVIDESKRERINEFIRKNVEEGGQVFIVCPLVEDSENFENLSSAVSFFQEYTNSAFRGYKVGLLHGKMNDVQKDEVIGAFANGDVQILVSTTVIEVGVNVPNANIMIVENAERFGLSSLHQLRGRVGRGARKSYCILFNQSEGQYASKRLDILKESNDGFKISEKDLELRGPGEFFGTRQHGVPALKLANLITDMSVLKEVQSACDMLVETGEISNVEVNGDFLIGSL